MTITRIRLRRGTAAEWAAANPLLTLGEPGFETDTNRLKLGDGVTAWNSLSYVGNGWKDKEGPLVVKATGAGRPVWSAIPGAFFEGYKWEIGDAAQFQWHVPHDHVIGSPVFVHAHWLSDGTNVQPVKWQWEIGYAHGFGEGHFPAAPAFTVTSQEAPDGVALNHMTSEIVSTFDPGAKTDGIIIAKLTRITNGGTDNTDGVYLIESDLHYLTDHRATPWRVPPLD